MQTTQEILSQVATSLETEKAVLAKIKASIERCETLPSVNSQQLLNLPMKVGKVVH